MPEPSSSLYEFAVRRYALPGVAPLCLRLQDEHGLDVDVVLAVLWQASRGIAVDDDALTRMLTAAAPAQARVLQLRALRRAVGSDRDRDPRWQATYQHLKSAELEAERVELACIEAACGPPPSEPPREPSEHPGLAHEALRRYAEHQGADGCAGLLRELVTLALS